MAGMTQHLPEPLQVFRGLAKAVAPGLRDVEAAYAKYCEQRDAGRILANSVVALRVELTYHSNAESLRRSPPRSGTIRAQPLSPGDLGWHGHVGVAMRP